MPTREGEGLKKWKAKAKASFVTFFLFWQKKFYLLAIFPIDMGNNLQSNDKSTCSEINFLVRFGDFRIYRKICHHNNIKIAIADRKCFCQNKRGGFFGAGVVLVYFSMLDFSYTFFGLLPSSFTFQSVIF